MKTTISVEQQLEWFAVFFRLIDVELAEFKPESHERLEVMVDDFEQELRREMDAVPSRSPYENGRIADSFYKKFNMLKYSISLESRRIARGI